MNHERAIEILRIAEEIQRRKKGTKRWVNTFGNQWYQLIPAAEKKIKAYDRFIRKMKKKYIKHQTKTKN